MLLRHLRQSVSTSHNPLRTIMSGVLNDVAICDDVKSKDYDGVVVVASAVSKVTEVAIKEALKKVVEVDKKAESGVFVTPCADFPGKRIIFSGTGPVDRDFDDVRA